MADHDKTEVMLANDCQMNNIHNTTVTLKSSKNGCYLSRIRVFLLVLIFIILVIFSIVLAILLSQASGHNHCFCPSSNSNHSHSQNTVSDGKEVVLSTSGPSRVLPWTNVRLPRDVIPSHYDLELKIDSTIFKFYGGVNISLNVLKRKNFLVMHKSHLRIDDQSVVLRRRNSIYKNRIVDQFYSRPNHFYFMKFEKDIEAGTDYILEIGSFRGRILADLKGLYQSSYKTKSGEVRKIVGSQLQSIDARKVFPCFDEPDLKATFNISIIHQNSNHFWQNKTVFGQQLLLLVETDVLDEYTALSNMPRYRSRVVSPEWTKVDFKRTPIMSTYILAFVVCDFEYQEKILEDNYELRIWAQPELKSQTDYALEFATKCYNYFKDYFGIPDVVPKADHVAFPDFSAGAMENWGLVLYREAALLYDPKVSSSKNKYLVTLIIAHEISHTWFGNMVTMKWWDDLWLNEGFASLLMYFAMEAVHPEWDVFAIQMVEEGSEVMLTDSLVTSHPVSTPIYHPNDIAQVFDKISYAKGMAVLRMLHNFLGHKNFQKGLQLYINKYMFKNAEMDDLWETFAQAVDHSIDVKTIMHTWTKQMGYPLITVTDKGDHYLLEQERFLFNSTRLTEEMYNSSFGYKWYVPFTYVTEEDRTQVRNQALVFESATIPKKSDGWIIGNYDYIGFYRVNYEEEMWQKLTRQLHSDHTVFKDSNRAGLLGDSFNLARAGMLNYSFVLNLTTYMKKETKYVPWRALLDSLKYLKGMFAKTEAYVSFQRYQRDLVEPVWEKTKDSQSNTLPDRYLRRILLSVACTVGVKSAIAYTRAMFQEWMEKGTRMDPDYSQIAYSVGVREGDVDEWNYVWNKTQMTNIAAEREFMLEALAQTEKPWLLWRYANWMFDSKKIKMQDVRLVVAYFAKNPLGRMIALHFLFTRWDDLLETFGGDAFVLREMIPAVTSYVNTEYELNQLVALFEEKPPNNARMASNEALAIIRSNILWMNKNYDTIAEWLKRYNAES